MVVGSLVAGLALPRIIRRLHLPPPDFAQEQVESQMLLAEAQLAGITRLDAEITEKDEVRVISRLRTNAVFLSEALKSPSPAESKPSPSAYRRLRRVMIAAEREAVLVARTEGRYQEDAVRAVLVAIDAEEAALKAGEPKKPGSIP